MASSSRPVAIVGGIRIPFARSTAASALQGNLDMLTAALAALVERFDLKRQRVGEVAAGAVIKHARDWNLAREAAQACGLDLHSPPDAVQRACGTRLTT